METDKVAGANAEAEADTIAGWMCSRIAKLTGLDVVDVSPETPFEDLGLNSSLVVTLTQELSDRTKVPLDVTVMYENPNIETLARFLVERQGLRPVT